MELSFYMKRFWHVSKELHGPAGDVLGKGYHVNAL